MSKWIAGVGAVAIVGVAGTLWLQHQDNALLRREVGWLRDEIRANASQAGSKGPNPSGSVAENIAGPAGRNQNLETENVAKIREELSALRNSVQELTKFAQMAQAAAALKNMSGNDASVATKLIPLSAWKNAGRASPEATTETILWAAAAGEVDTLTSSLAFTPTAREKADAWFAGLPAASREQHGTPERVIALMIARDAATLSGMQVLGQKEITADDVGVRFRVANTEGKTKDETLVMHRANDGWRMLLSDQVVEKFSRQLSGKK